MTTYLNDNELADRFGVSRQTIWRWHREEPTFPRAIKLSSACTRWRLCDVEAWEDLRAAGGV